MISRRLSRSWLLTLMLAMTALITLPGCQTYVNIPAQSGDVANGNINGSNVQALLVEALRGLRDDLLTAGKYQVILPAGAVSETYNNILKTVGEPYTWTNNPDSANVVDKLEVRAVRIRGWYASVDIVRSSQPGDPAAPRQLVTVYLRQYVFGGWSTQRVRVWRLNVDDALLQSSGEQVDQSAVRNQEDPATPSTGQEPASQSVEKTPPSSEGKPAESPAPTAAP